MQLIVTDPTLIEQVYSGKAGKCCCGCSGNYSAGTRNVKAHVTRMNKRAADEGSTWNLGDNNVCLETYTRYLIVYPKMDIAQIRRDGDTILVTRKEA